MADRAGRAAARSSSSPAPASSVVLGAAILTSLLPADAQDVVFRTPLLIVVLIVGTAAALWRIARPRRDARPVDDRAEPPEQPSA